MLLLQRLMTSGVALSLGLLVGVGVFVVTPDNAHAKASPVEACRALEDYFGEDTFRAVYKSFGGCVSNFTASHNSAAAPAHGCHFLVDRGLFKTHGECVNVFKNLD